MQFHDGCMEYIPSVMQGNAVPVFLPRERKENHTNHLPGITHKSSARNYKQVTTLLFTCRSTVTLSTLVLRLQTGLSYRPLKTCKHGTLAK
jgi:hypothetical protein